MTTNPQKERMIGRYDPQKWVEKTEVGKHIFIWKFIMRGKEIPGWTLIKAIPEQIYEERRILTYLWQKDEGNAEILIKIDTVESISWHRAHETLLTLLGEYQGPRLLEATSRKIELGDVAFVGFGETVQPGVFARANMAVRIHNVGNRDISVVDIAKKIDELFVSRPRLSGRGVIPEIELFSSERKVAKVNRVITLNIKAKDPLDRPLWYKFMTDQGELFVRDEKVCFSSKIPGHQEISFFAVNEDGFAAGTTLSIRVK